RGKSRIRPALSKGSTPPGKSDIGRGEVAMPGVTASVEIARFCTDPMPEIVVKDVVTHRVARSIHDCEPIRLVVVGSQVGVYQVVVREDKDPGTILVRPIARNYVVVRTIWAEANQHPYRVVLRPIVSDSVLLGTGNHCNSEHTILHLIISHDVRLAHIIHDPDTRKSVTNFVVLHRVTAGLGEPNPNKAVLHGVVLNRPK